MTFLPDFIKIDVEGHELAVLNGAKKLISSNTPPMMMVEIQADHREILQILRDCGYKLFKADGEMIDESLTFGSGNIFALHPAFHQERLEAWSYQLEYNSTDV